MARSRRKVYKFSDEVMAVDSIIAYIFSGIAFACILGSIVYAIVKMGEIASQFGAVLLASAVMSVTGLFFSLLAYKDQNGGVLSKRFAVILSVVNLILLIFLYYI